MLLTRVLQVTQSCRLIPEVLQLHTVGFQDLRDHFPDVRLCIFITIFCAVIQGSKVRYPAKVKMVL